MSAQADHPPVLWIVQTNLGSASDIATFVDALEAERIPCYAFNVAPFTDDIPDLESNGPVVCYGSTNFVRTCRVAGRWVPGVWHDDENFTWSAWAEHLGELLLNAPNSCELTTISGLLASTRPDDQLVFVRPDRDMKEFSGEVAEIGKLRTWCREVMAGRFDQLGPDTRIVLGTPFRIRAEWRLFIVAGKVVAASQYHRDGRLKPEEAAPADVRAFAEVAARRWSPASVFTLDICRSGDGLYIVEAQGFNSAGTYHADVPALLRAVSRQAALEWAGSRP